MNQPWIRIGKWNINPDQICYLRDEPETHSVFLYLTNRDTIKLEGAEADMAWRAFSSFSINITPQPQKEPTHEKSN